MTQRKKQRDDRRAAAIRAQLKLADDKARLRRTLERVLDVLGVRNAGHDLEGDDVAVDVLRVEVVATLEATT